MSAVSADKGASSDADVRSFGTKTLDFQNFWCVHTDKGNGGWASADILQTRGG